MNMNIDDIGEDASALISMKRTNDYDEGDHLTKKSRTEETPHFLGAPAPHAFCTSEELKPHPFFYYKDYSNQPDPDTLALLTPPGRVPNFPAKMHAILSRPDLAEVICWMSHGRAWKILKPREFEIRVIPTYFEHAKFASFIRQANGWGFRRITSGRDRNSYYHPQFLRGLPHLCKAMKRPGVAQKVPSDPEHEPDLFKISEMFPVPEQAQDDSIMLHSTLQGGPRARMSIESILPHRSVAYTSHKQTALTPSDQEALSSFQQSLGGGGSSSDVQMMNITAPTHASPHGFSQSATAAFPQSTFVSSHFALASANEMAFSNHPFAAGFAAATAMNQEQLYEMMVAQQYFLANNKE